LENWDVVRGFRHSANGLAAHGLSAHTLGALEGIFLLVQGQLWPRL
jgi:hypothetical protein